MYELTEDYSIILFIIIINSSFYAILIRNDFDRLIQLFKKTLIKIDNQFKN